MEEQPNQFIKTEPNDQSINTASESKASKIAEILGVPENDVRDTLGLPPDEETQKQLNEAEKIKQEFLADVQARMDKISTAEDCDIVLKLFNQDVRKIKDPDLIQKYNELRKKKEKYIFEELNDPEIDIGRVYDLKNKNIYDIFSERAEFDMFADKLNTVFSETVLRELNRIDTFDQIEVLHKKFFDPSDAVRYEVRKKWIDTCVSIEQIKKIHQEIGHQRDNLIPSFLYVKWLSLCESFDDCLMVLSLSSANGSRAREGSDIFEKTVEFFGEIALSELENTNSIEGLKSLESKIKRAGGGYDFVRYSVPALQPFWRKFEAKYYGLCKTLNELADYYSKYCNTSGKLLGASFEEKILDDLISMCQTASDFKIVYASAKKGYEERRTKILDKWIGACNSEDEIKEVFEIVKANDSLKQKTISRLGEILNS